MQNKPITLILLLATLALAADVYVNIESPGVTATLLGLSSFASYSSGSLTIDNVNAFKDSNGVYSGKAFTPGAKIVVVDTGVLYSEGNFLCNIKGAATASLINYLESNNLCLSSGTVKMSEIQSVLPTVILVDGGSAYNLPSADEEYKYCITTTEVLSNANFNVRQDSIPGDDPTIGDTIIILQPTDWRTDLVGHGTQVVSALCGTFTVEKDLTADLGGNVKLIVYTGSAIGADVFVVDTETLAIILPDYTPQIAQGMTPQALIKSAQISGEVTTFYLDYDFKYLGTALGEKAIVQAISDAKATTDYTSLIGTSKPIVLIGYVLSDTQSNVNNYCNDLENAIGDALAIVAPLGNNGLDVNTLNQGGIYLWPAQCNDLITPTVPVYPVTGVVVGIDATSNNNVTVESTSQFNYNENSNNLWFAMPAAINPTKNYLEIANYGTDVNNKQYTLKITFNGMPVLMSSGSIECPSGTYGQIAIPIDPNNDITYDSTNYILNIQLSGTSGTSIAAAYFASVLALLSKDPTAQTPEQVYSHLDAMTKYINEYWGHGVDNDYYSYHQVSFQAIWEAAIEPDTGNTTDDFPYSIGNSNSMPNLNQLPSNGGSGTTQNSTSTEQPLYPTPNNLREKVLEPSSYETPRMDISALAILLLIPILIILRKGGLR